MQYHFSEDHFSDIGLTVSYVECVQAKNTLGFEIGNSSYLMYDSYCKNSNCACTNVHLYLPELNGKKEYVFTFDYQKKEFAEFDVPNELREKIENDDKLHELFSNRHLFIKKAFALKENERKVKAIQNIKQYLEIGGKKIGRNEPCSCGSGKKYKNCCGK